MDNWIAACKVDDVDCEDLIGFEHDGHSYAIYRSPDDRFYATDGLCTHEEVELEAGLVMGHLIECPKHNARFDYRSGEAVRAPACVKLKTYPVKVVDGEVYIDVSAPP